MLSLWNLVRRLLGNERIKFRIYIFLNRPRSWIDLTYQFSLGLLIFICMILTMISTKDSHLIRNRFIFWLDLSIAIIFAIEFVVRLWSSTCLHRYRNWRGIHIIFHPMFMLDLFVLLTTLTVLCFNIQETMLAVGLRGFRMLHFFENRYKLWKIVTSVVWSQRYQLAIVTYFCIIWLLVFSLAIYFVESSHNPKMTSISKAIWFTLVTFTTVGYGDIVPVSLYGKILASIGMIVGVSIFALPGGVIGAGLALKVQHQKTSRSRYSLKERLAANMLQIAWRLFYIRKHIQQTLEKDYSSKQINLIINNQRIHFILSPKAKDNIEMKENISQNYHRINAHSLYFIYLLRYMRYKKQLSYAQQLSDTNTFYEIYAQNTQSTTEILKNLQDKLNNIERFIENFEQNFKQNS